MSFKKDSYYFIAQYSENSFYHGGIGLVDAEKILTGLKFKAIQFPHVYDFSIGKKILRFAFTIKLFLYLPSGSVIVTPFQVHSFLTRFLVYRMLPLKKIRIVCLICDIDGMRDGDEQLLQREIALLKKQKYFIVHNARMQDWLNAHVERNISVLLYLFDFLANPPLKKRHKSNTVVFAGNLSKARFIDNLDQLVDKAPNLRFFIYGDANRIISKLLNNVTFKGAYEPYSLPSITEGSFGLVWDGDSIHGCKNSYGEYLRINSPHKLSFYILCGLPVIVWDQAATASFVTENNIGITISSLVEIEDKINLVSDAHYQEMCHNTQSIADKISTGGYLKKAIEEMLEIIQREK